MKYLPIFISIYFVTGLLSCKQGDNETKVACHDTVYLTKTLPEGKFTMEMDSLMRVALANGDHAAFKNVHMFYAERLRDQELLTFTLQMANKYKYDYAYFTVYTILANQNNYGLKNLDEQTRDFAMYYLLRSYELGYKDAHYSIEEELGAGALIPKSDTYLAKFADDDKSKK